MLCYISVCWLGTYFWFVVLRLLRFSLLIGVYWSCCKLTRCINYYLSMLCSLLLCALFGFFCLGRAVMCLGLLVELLCARCNCVMSHRGCAFGWRWCEVGGLVMLALGRQLPHHVYSPIKNVQGADKFSSSIPVSSLLRICSEFWALHYVWYSSSKTFFRFRNSLVLWTT
jgi:hypothetical protein